jgi:hypothetical protein
MQYRKIAMLACVLAIASGAAFAGINSKEVGAVLIYPTYQAYNGNSNIDTYISITNDKNLPIIAHFEVIGGVACDDCSFDLPLTPYQTKRLLLNREALGGSSITRIYDASPHSYTGDGPVVLSSCSEPEGFVVVTTEDPNTVDAVTLGENVLHGDLVIVDLGDGTSSQMGAIAVQSAGQNDGNRWIEFDGMEYERFPSKVTGNFWSPNAAVVPQLVLFNVDFETGEELEDIRTECDVNYVDAEEMRFNADWSFGCYSRVNLFDLASGTHEDNLGTANGFLWAECDEGTHGAIITDLEDTTTNYDYPDDSQHADTLFQSTTLADDAKLKLTRFVQNDEPK